MKIVETKATSPGRAFRGEYIRIIREFVESDMECAEIMDLDARTETAYRCFMKHIKRNGFPIYVSKNGGRLFLFKGTR